MNVVDFGDGDVELILHLVEKLGEMVLGGALVRPGADVTAIARTGRPQGVVLRAVTIRIVTAPVWARGVTTAL